MVEVLERQGVHVVAGGHGVEHVRLEHAVVLKPAHLNALLGVAADGAVGQYVDVVLGVLPDLGFIRVFQDWLERAQYRIAIQLRRYTHVRMGQRNVGRFIWLDGERNSDQLRLLSIEAGGFGIECNQVGLMQFSSQTAKRSASSTVS